MRIGIQFLNFELQMLITNIITINIIFNFSVTATYELRGTIYCILKSDV